MSDDETTPSVIPGPTAGQLDDVARALRAVQSEAPTLVACDWCSGHGMVTPEKAAEWRSAYPELSQGTP